MADGDLLQTLDSAHGRGKGLKRVGLDGRMRPSLYLPFLKSHRIFC